MKLLLENWNKFLQEQEINEATEQEIEYLNDALEIPIGELPFGNIFGDSYRIIEPVSGLKEKTPLANAIFALNKFGWEVNPASDLEYHDETKGKLAGKVKGGKILCTKTKVSHYIDGKGNQGISRKSITLNLPKVLAGIINFVNNSRDKLSKEAGAEMFTAAKRYADAAKEGKLDELPADVKYSLPANISDPNIKHTANEYRKIMRFYDAQVYWLRRKNTGKLKFLFNAVGVDFESFENFAKYAMDSFDDLIRNMDQYISRNYIIYSRHPIDVFRMSDHEGIQSCHSLPSEKGEDRFDQYNKCALSEAYGNGMIAYIVPAKDFKMFPPTQESLDKVADEEIFYDQVAVSGGRDGGGELVPTSRIRIKHVAFHKDENSEPIRLAVSQDKIYGPRVPGFSAAVNNKMAKVQEKEIKEIIKQGSEDLGKPTIFLSKFTRYGGSYQDTGHSVAQTLPILFRKHSRDLVLQGSAVKYEPDVEEALIASIGQNGAEVMKQRLNEIFDYNMGGFISFNWDVEEDYDGEPYYQWKMLVTFYMTIPEEGTNGSEIRNAVVDAVDGMATDYYGLPETDNVFVSLNDENRWHIQLVYDGNDFDDTSYLGGLESNLPEIVQKFNVFDYYHEDGAIQLIEYQLEEYGVIEAERHNVQNVMRDFGLPDDSWWNEDEREMGETDYFGGEYLEFIAFEDYTSLEIEEIKEKIPENMKQAAYKHIADFLNLVTKSDELAGKLALNQDTWDKIKDPGIVITYDGSTQDLTSEEVAEQDTIDLKAGVSMYNDYPVQRLQKTAYFLKNNASIDDINERILAALEKYVADKLKGQQNITENKKRIRIHVRR
jgi:hypothetical protein